MPYQCTIIEIRESKCLHDKFSLSVAGIDRESRFNTLSWEAAFLQRLAICLLNVRKLSMSIPKRVIQGSLFKVLSPINSCSFTN